MSSGRSSQSSRGKGKESAERIQFFDTSERNPTALQLNSEDDWKEQLFENTKLQKYKTAKVRKYYTYRSQLENFIGKLLYRKDYGHDKKIEHNYLVIEVEQEGENSCFVSFDKHRDNNGCIIVQYGVDRDSVALNLEGTERKQPELITEISNITGVNHFRYVKPATFGAMFDNLEKHLDYSLFKANCQTLARKLRKALSESNKKNSEMGKLMLKIPGKQEYVDIDDNIVVEFMEGMYTDWSKNILVKIPEVRDETLNPVTDTGEDLEVKADEGTEGTNAEKERDELLEFEKLRLEQKCVNNICEIFEGNDRWKNERKAVYFNLTHQGIEQAVQTFSRYEDDNSQEAPWSPEFTSSVWKHSFDVLLLTSSAAFIFVFREKAERSEAEENDDEERAELLREVSGMKEEQFINIVSLCINNDDEEKMKEKSEKGEKTKYGRHFFMPLSTTDITSATPAMRNYMSKWETASLSDDESKEKMEKLASQIWILQSMENETNLIHQKIVEQKWGNRNVMLWTPSQKECLDFVSEKFRETKGIRLVVSGCQGSGKTLVLMKVAREYVRQFPRKRVFISVSSSVYKKLIGELYEAILKDSYMQSNVDIGNVYNSNGRWIRYTKVTDSGVAKEDVTMETYGLILQDETHGVDFDLEACKHAQESQHVILFSSKHNIIKSVNKYCQKKQLRTFDVKELKGNLRSSSQIVALIEHFQDLTYNWNCRVKCNLEFDAPPVDVICHELDERETFVAECVQKIKEIDVKYNSSRIQGKITVSWVCHGYLINQIQKQMTQENVVFLSPIDMLGCQYEIVVLIIDPITYSNITDITNVLTRATNMLSCIINTSMQQMQINGQPCIEEKALPRTEVTKYVGELVQTHTKVWLDDATDINTEKDFTKKVLKNLLEEVEGVEEVRALDLESGDKVTHGVVVQVRCDDTTHLSSYILYSTVPYHTLKVSSNHVEVQCRIQKRMIEQAKMLHDFFTTYNELSSQ